MKIFLKVLLAVYLFLLLWLVLFKFSFDIMTVITTHQARSVSLIPFAEYSQSNAREMIDNFAVFIPFGLLLSANFKRTGLGEKLLYIFVFSLTVEVAQFVLAIGITDITDVILNTLGGLAGLLAYKFIDKHAGTERLDQVISIIGVTLLVLFILIRFFVIRIRY